ncbi:ClpP family protease [Actinospongicola halichondriae]|uniref:ClpP family protease n=1 Tax=Actinospongicola halichondriae TaxID=3236844 RepID=UPI003D4D3441
MSTYTIPSVIESTPKGERVSDIFSRLLSERIIFVGTPIDDGVANVVIAQMLHLAAESPAEIQLYLNSPGGSFSAVMAVYDTMQFVSPDVATLCVGQAASTSAILLAAGAPGRRSMLPHARAVLQQPHTEGSRGSISDLALEAAEIARIRRQAEGLLARHTDRDPDHVRADIDRALVLTGADAIDYGIVDVVVEADSGRQHAQVAAALRPGP